MIAADVIDMVIDAPVLTSYTRVGFEIRTRCEHWKPLDQYDLNGCVMVLTGATSGLGKAAATQLARCGATLVLVGRRADRNEVIAEEISKVTGNTSINQVAADMGDYEQVRVLADWVLTHYDRLDVLIHNAGALVKERRDSADGTEATVASQVIGPFLLTALLLERLAASAPSRVLTMSSGGAYTSALTVSQLEMQVETYKGTKQYARAKRAQLSLNELWSKRFGHLDVHFHAVHPGWVDTPGVRDSMPVFAKLMGPFLRTAEQGADTLVWLAADDKPLESNGKFWFDRRSRDVHKLRFTATSDTAYRRQHLWEWVSDTAGCDLPGAFRPVEK